MRIFLYFDVEKGGSQAQEHLLIRARLKEKSKTKIGDALGR